MKPTRQVASARRVRRGFTFESLEGRSLLSGDPILDNQPLIISEFIANSTAPEVTRIRSSVGEPFRVEVAVADWIELMNVSQERLDLGGLHLTDDVADPSKWEFPSGTWIEAGGFHVVAASGEDLRDPSLDEKGLLHTNFRLSASGEYLALTDRAGAVIHEFAPGYPAQRVDVSYSIPMVARTILDAEAPVEYRVPTDNSREPTWRDVGFSDASWIREGAISPLGFDRGDGPAESGETIGPELSDLPSIDFARGSIVVLESTPFTQAGRVSQWSLYSEKKLAITPLVFGQRGEEFEVVGVGRTRTSDGSGTQTFAFDLQAGSDIVESDGYFFGFKDGDNEADNAGVVGWSRSDTDLVRRYSGPNTGRLVVGQPLSGGSSFGRTYSVQATSSALLAGPINTNLQSAMTGATSLQVRYPFVASQLDNLRSLALEVRYEDGFVAYLNGIEVARRNLPATVRFDSVANSNRAIKHANSLESVNISQFRGLLIEGQNVLAIHAFNDSGDSGDFLIDARLVGVDIASVAGAGFTAEPTLGRTNGLIFSDLIQPTIFSHPHGLYREPFVLELSTAGSPEANIYYTLDGTDPRPGNPAALRYQQPLSIESTTVLRAASYQAGRLPSLPVTYTYIFPVDVAAQETLQPAVVQDPVWGPQFTDSLRALPTVSLVTSSAITVTDELATSMELIFPDGREGFQVNAGVEVFGGTAVSFPKRSLRVSFKNIYGPSSLEYDVFGDPNGVVQFDQLLLRPGSHDTPFWTGSTGAGNYIRNRWASDRQLEMGQPAPRGQFVQLYLNGVYWGQYQLLERPNAAFMAANFGGDKSDYDVLNAGRVIDGDDVAWNALLDSLDDGYDAVQQYLDVVNYADYILLEWFGGNDVDWRSESNWMAARRREPGAGFQFFAWDSDIILRSGATTDIVNYGGPGFLWTRNGGVQQYPEFLELLAERAQLHFFDGGMFTPERLRAQIDQLADQTRLSVIAETARWGSGRYTPATWESAIEWMKQTYAPEHGPSRAEIVIEQMRHAGVFPLADTPQFTVDGQSVPAGRLQAGDTLRMSAPQGEVYYTLDGSDPQADSPTVQYTPLVDESTPVRVLIPTDSALSSDWLGRDFDDAAWIRGQNGVGYDTAGELLPLVRLDLESSMKDVSSAAYLRVPFQLDDPAQFDSLEFAVRYDDGFVAYLNGVEVARRNARGEITWSSRASEPHANLEASQFEPFDLTREMHLLRAGENILAIQGLNTEPSNVDFLITPLLRAGTVVDRGISPLAILYSGPLVVPPDAEIMARTLWKDQWSPPRAAEVPQPVFPLRVSEVMYHPADPSDAEEEAGFSDDDDFEFIELVNISDASIELSGVRLAPADVGGRTEGVEFDFSQGRIRQLAPGQRVLVVERIEAFAFRYGDALPVAGQWSGGLSNSSEQITVLVEGDVLQRFTYSDEWHPASDGDGPSLEFVDASRSDLSLWDRADGWRASVVWGGTPGTPGPTQVPGDSNRDGVFDATDLLFALQAGEYEDGLANNSTFEEGDWDGDGDFTTADLVFAFKQGNYVGDGPRPAQVAPTMAFAGAVARQPRDDFATTHELRSVWLAARDGRESRRSRRVS